MKNTKIFFTLLVLAAAVFTFGCNQPAGSNKSGSLNGMQKDAYEYILGSFEEAAKQQDVSADTVKSMLKLYNDGDTASAAEGLKKSMGMEIVDTQPGTPVAKGTKKDALCKRFIVKLV